MGPPTSRPWSFYEMAKWVLRRFLGQRRFSDLREWLGAPRLSHGAPERSGQETWEKQTFDLAARLKGYVTESLARRRALEKELARMRYPELYKAELDVIVEIFQAERAAPSSADSASVIITNFNYGRYVQQALESVIAQTHGSVELVVVDSASTDSSPETLREMLGKVSTTPWRLARLKHNVGPAAARNVGVRLARCEFVFILDADNHLLSTCVENHVRAALQGNADAAYGIIRTFGAAPRLLSDRPLSTERLAQGPYIDAMALFRRSALLQIGLYSTEPALDGWEDYELWVRFAALGRTVAFIPEVLSHYRSHEHSLISVASLDTRGAWTYLFDNYPGIFGTLSADDKMKEAERRARLATLASLRTSKHQSDAEAECKCRDGFKEL